MKVFWIVCGNFGVNTCIGFLCMVIAMRAFDTSFKASTRYPDGDVSVTNSETSLKSRLNPTEMSI